MKDKNTSTTTSQNGEVNKDNNLAKNNKDYIGWINVPGTTIDYSVVKGEDNKYYLDHDISKEKSVWGAIFMDCENNGDETDKNTILYGHNMKHGSMFTDLCKYKNKEFFDKNRYIYFKTLDEEEVKWEIFSVYVTDTKFNYIKTNFNTLQEYGQFSNDLKQKSKFTNNVEVTENNRILTLSTCSYEFKNARFVVHAKQITPLNNIKKSISKI